MADPKSYLKGRLLLDGGKLAGSFFHRTVVLICEHNEQGAMGLVLNKSTDNEVGEVTDADLPDHLCEHKLFLGGPVDPSTLTFLYSEPFLPDSNVIENLMVGHSFEELVEIGARFIPDSNLRMFAGYAGWSPGQLESEMERDAWLTHPASLDLIFMEDTEALWKTIMVEKGGIYRLLSDAPDDLSLN